MDGPTFDAPHPTQGHMSVVAAPVRPTQKHASFQNCNHTGQIHSNKIAQQAHNKIAPYERLLPPRNPSQRRQSTIITVRRDREGSRTTHTQQHRHHTTALTWYGYPRLKSGYTCLPLPVTSRPTGAVACQYPLTLPGRTVPPCKPSAVRPSCSIQPLTVCAFFTSANLTTKALVAPYSGHVIARHITSHHVTE